MTADGFLRTGDVAVMDERGFLRIVDRIKDMILVSGFNVYPNEIEEVVMLHPDVYEVAAVGKSSPVTGEMVKIFVVKKRPELTQEQLLVHCRENLTAYKVPREVEFLDELPKSAVVADVVYIPGETPLLTTARRNGHPTVNGLGMLLHQARPAWQAWFGIDPQVTPEMRALIEKTI